MWTDHKWACLWLDKATTGIQWKSRFCLHELEVKAKCKISLLQLIRIITRSHKTAAAFVIRLGEKGGGRRSQQTGFLRSCIHKQKKKKKVFLSIILNNKKKTKKNKVKVKERKNNLAITAANSGDKPSILTLVVEEQTKRATDWTKSCHCWSRVVSRD